MTDSGSNFPLVFVLGVRLHREHLSYPNGPLFDWEYAGLGCRYFDIASCCITNALSPQNINKLCSSYAYLANVDIHQVIKNVQEMSVLVSLTHSLWAESVGIDKNLE
jgi:hypothetical protein